MTHNNRIRVGELTFVSLADLGTGEHSTAANHRIAPHENVRPYAPRLDFTNKFRPPRGTDSIDAEVSTPTASELESRYVFAALKHAELLADASEDGDAAAQAYSDGKYVRATKAARKSAESAYEAADVMCSIATTLEQMADIVRVSGHAG